VPVPRSLCLTKSRQIRAVLQRFSPIVEPASIDEAYMDLSGTQALYRDESLHDTALRIQRSVVEETGIAVSIGGGSSRIVAKLAAGSAKPAGVRIVEPGGEIAFMRGFDLADIPGVGPVFARTLEGFGLRTVEQALRFDRLALEQWLGDSRGDWLHRRVRGIDGGEVESGREARSMSREETFAVDLLDDEPLEIELLALATRLGQDLRREGLRARTITVKLRDADFRTRRASHTIAAGIEVDRVLFSTARELLHRLRRARRTGARLLGVSVSNLEASLAVQLGMFDEAAVESERDRRLSRATDQARARFGPAAVRPGRLLDRP
jgi:DNA polymerase-4